MNDHGRPAVPAPDDDLDPALGGRLRRMLVDHARSDAAGHQTRRHHGRIAGAVVGFAAVAAIAAGALTIAVGGVPWLIGPPVATQPALPPSPAPTATPSPTATPTPTPTPPAIAPDVPPAPTVQQFRDAVTAAKYDCSTWTASDVPSAIDGGWCEPAAIGYLVFADQAGVDAVIALSEASDEPGRFLRGPTWLVSADSPSSTGDELVALQSLLGGQLTFDPSTVSADYRGYDARQLWDRCVQAGVANEPGAEVIVPFDLRYVSDTPDGQVQVLVAWDTPAEPKPTGVVWICHFDGDPADPVLEYFNAKDI